MYRYLLCEVDKSKSTCLVRSDIRILSGYGPRHAERKELVISTVQVIVCTGTGVEYVHSRTDGERDEG